MSGRVRDLPEIKILKCKNCGVVFLEDFDHIDDDFYTNSKMRSNDSSEDWETHLKECLTDDIIRVGQFLPQIKNKRVLDFGCGGGGFLLNIDRFAKCAEGVEKDKVFCNTL